MDNVPPPFPNGLRACIEATGLTQAEVARKAGIQYQSLSNLVVGKRKLHAGWLKKLKSVLPFTHEEILTTGPLHAEEHPMEVSTLTVQLLKRIEQHLADLTQLVAARYEQLDKTEQNKVQAITRRHQQVLTPPRTVKPQR